MVRRKVSVDFSIPPALPPFHEGAHESKLRAVVRAHPRPASEPNVYFVPVALLRKWPPLLDFDLRDEHGSPLPLLTTAKNREVDAAAVFGLAPEGDARDCLKDLLEKIPREDGSAARQALDGVGTYLNARLHSMSTDDVRAWLPVLHLGAALVGNSLLWVRVEAYPGQRQVIKFSFIEYLSRELVLRRRLLSALGWIPRRYGFLLPNMGERETYHLEIEPPQDLVVYGQQLSVRSLPTGDPQGRNSATRLTAPVRAIGRAVRSRFGEVLGTAGFGRERAYYYAKGTHHQYGLATVDLAIGNRALLSSALRASIVVTALLAVFWVARGSVVHHVDGAVAVMVIFPALVTLLVMRAGEHPMMRQMIAGVRFLLVASAMLPVVDAAIVLAYAHPRAGDVHFGFLLVFLVGMAITGLLAISWLLPGEDPQNDVVAISD